MTGIEPGWKDAPEIQGKGSTSWHEPEQAMRAYLGASHLIKAEANESHVTVLNCLLRKLLEPAHVEIIDARWRYLGPFKGESGNRRLKTCRWPEWRVWQGSASNSS